MRGIGATHCCWCGAEEDSIEHMSDCRLVHQVFERICADTGLMDEWRPSSQSSQWGTVPVGGSASIRSVQCPQRGCSRKGAPRSGRPLLWRLVSLVEHPWLTCTGPQLERSERRALRARPPQPVEDSTCLYRADRQPEARDDPTVTSGVPLVLRGGKQDSW